MDDAQHGHQPGMSMLVDACVHPLVQKGDDLREYMEMPWKKRVFSPVHRYAFSSPQGEYHEPARSAVGLPGSDIARTEEQLFGELGVDVGILLPLTRGINMDPQVSSAVCRATNDWLGATWLSRASSAGRFKGTIRVNPREPEAAVAEIERWAGDPRMVQIGVPTAALAPYGEPGYFAIWEAAARAGLPVAVKTDGGSGVEYQSSPVGSFRHHAEWSTFTPFVSAYHLASLIMHGVFDRLPDLRFVFADGGGDLNMPMVWRLIADWRAGTDDHPWTRRSPPEYLRPHVRFIHSRMEGPTTPDLWPRWHEITEAAHLTMYGSTYPHWTFAPPASVQATGTVRDRILGGTATDLYRGLVLPSAASTPEGTPA